MLTVHRAAERLIAHRQAGQKLESDFATALDVEAVNWPLSAKYQASEWGISDSLLSAMRRGRRRVSDQVLERIVGSL